MKQILKKLVSYCMITILTLSTFTTPTSAQSTFENEESLQTALDYLQERSAVNEMWNDLSINTSETLFNENGVVNGVVYELTGNTHNGYIIVKEFENAEYVVSEASPYDVSPFAQTSLEGESIYLGPLNYFVIENGSEMITDLYDGERYLPANLMDTFSTYSAQNSTYGDIEMLEANDTFVPFVTEKIGFPSISQKIYINNVVKWTHCAPTAAANITRYRYLYYDLEYGDSAWNTYTGYESLVKSIGVAMGTGENGFPGTYGTSVAPNFVTWLNENTKPKNKVVTVGENFYDTNSDSVNWKSYYTAIRDGDPVMITVGNAIFSHLREDQYHTVTGYGFHTKDDGKTYAFVADPEDASLKEIFYECHGNNWIYAIYPVHFAD